jgi:cytochrome c oxidase subunit 2
LNRPPRVLSLPLALLLVLIALAVAGCGPAETGGPTGPAGGGPGFFPPTAASEQGRQISGLYNFVFWVATAIFVLVEGLIIWAVLRYRRRDDTLPTQTHGNLVAEAVWTLVPTIIVVVLFVLSLDTINKVEAKVPESDRGVTVDVTGFQWQWTFEYKEDGLKFTGAGEEGPEMVLPVGETVHIKLHAQDVIHAFYVPQFLYKKDVVPGRENSFDVLIEQPGVYAGQCAEFCGLDHARMNFTVRAVPRAEYDAWVAAEAEKARATPEPAPSGATSVAVSAANATAFEQQTLEVPADTPIVFDFENKDPAAPHNVAVKGGNPDGTDFVGMPLAQPGQRVPYNAPALKAGEYTFFCSVHPNMTGTLTVQ